MDLTEDEFPIVRSVSSALEGPINFFRGGLESVFVTHATPTAMRKLVPQEILFGDSNARRVGYYAGFAIQAVGYYFLARKFEENAAVPGLVTNALSLYSEGCRWAIEKLGFDDCAEGVNSKEGLD